MQKFQTPGSPAAPGAHFRPDIQGLRAVAVLLVVIYHTGALGFSGGYIGVDVFFVISGYLITNHLFNSLKSHGVIGLSDFYSRRIRRILPASLFVLLASLVAILTFAPPVVWPSAFADAVYVALYLPNIWFAMQRTDYLAESYPSPFQHYWSLGVEEQFYLLWPIILFAAWRGTRASLRGFSAVILLLTVASFIGGWWLTYSSPASGFFGLLSRAWELGVGGIAAILGGDLFERIPEYLRAMAAWGGLVAILGAAIVYDSTTAFPGWAAAVPVLATGIVIVILREPPRGGPGGLLGSRPMVFIGSISYSLYLVHWPMQTIPAAASGRPLDPFVAIVLALVSMPLAWVLFRFVEYPFRRSKQGGGVLPRPTVGLAVVASVMSVVLIFCSAAFFPKPPLDAGTQAASTMGLSTILADNSAFSGFVPSDLRPRLGVVDKDVPKIYEDDCFLSDREKLLGACSYGDLNASASVALFGDSHAAQWFPALNTLGMEYGFRVDVFTKADCPPLDVEYQLNGVEYSECSYWRAAVVDWLVADPPDVVVLAGRNDPPNQPNGGIQEDTWTRGLGSMVRSLKSSRVVFIADTPRFGLSPRICLSANLHNTRRCDTDRGVALNADLASAERAAALHAGAAVIDLNDHLCTEDTCGMIVGRTMVYRDDHHMTATAALALAPALWSQLEGVVADD